MEYNAMAWTAPRTWVAGELVTAAIMNQYVRDEFNALAPALLMLNAISGRYYTLVTVSSFQAVAITANQLYAHPFMVMPPGTFDQIAINCTVAVAGNVRLGIYSDNNGSPGALLKDIGVVTVGTTGVKTIAISPTIALNVGSLYWLVALSDTTATLTHLSAVGPAFGTLGFLGEGSPIGNPVVCVYHAQAYGALPDPYGAITGRAACPAVYLRAA